METENGQKRFETSFAVALIGDDGIMQVYFKPTKGIFADDAREFRLNVLGMTQKSVPVLYDLRESGYVSDEAVDAISDDYANRMITALAVLVRKPSIWIRLMALLLTGMKKVKYPLKVFTDKEKALLWLKRYVR